MVEIILKCEMHVTGLTSVVIVWCCSPREFIDCVTHIRVLSWLLIGSLTHTAVTKAAAVTVCQPFDLAASSYIADHIMVILTGFAEQSKVCYDVSIGLCVQHIAQS